MLEFSNPLFESIVVEDELDTITVEFQKHDFVTGDSIPCCTEENIDSTDSATVCLEGTANLFYSRETYDCGSYYDIGAATDIRRELFIEDQNIIQDTLTCMPGIDASTTIVIDSTTTAYVTPDDLIASGTVDSTTILDTTAEFTVWQSGGFANFDAGGTFDCTTNFDYVEITVEPVQQYLLTELGGHLLLEDGARLVI